MYSVSQSQTPQDIILLRSMVLAIGTYSLLHVFLPEKAALVGAFLLVSAPHALEIYVRGNLAELWFLALFQLSWHLLKTLIRFTRTLFFSFSTDLFTIIGYLTMHYLLLVRCLWVSLHGCIRNRIKYVHHCFFLGLLCASYFLIPAFAELTFTHATGNCCKHILSRSLCL